MHISWMMLRKQGALNNQMLRPGYCLPPYQNSWLRACAGQWVKRDNQFVSDAQAFALAQPDVACAKGCHIFFFHTKSRLKSTFGSEEMFGCLNLVYAL